LALHSLEESMPLREAQRNALIALLVEELKPARTSSEHNWFILMGRIALVPEDKIKPLLTDTQWKTWDKRLQSYKKLIQNWRREGVLSVEEIGDPPQEAAK
jgi:hypothetical protein